MGWVAVCGDRVFCAALFVEERFVTEFSTPVGQAQAESGAIGADPLVADAEAQRLVILVQLDLLDAADGQNAPGLGEFLGEDGEFDIGTQQSEIGAAAAVGSNRIRRTRERTK